MPSRVIPSLRLAATALAAAVALSACGSGESSQPASTPTTARAGGSSSDATREARQDQVAGADAAIPLLGFSAERVGGGSIVGADYAGTDVAIWFWAPW
ncbi:MAG TPA: hypothetical protein VGA13_10340 [Acidimicrobiales bacterium]